MTDEQPTGKKRSRMVGFYVGLGIAASLLVGLWLTRKPLKLRYQVYQLDNYRAKLLLQTDGDETLDRYEEMMAPCLDAAANGNAMAMEAVIRNGVIREEGWHVVRNLLPVMISQPEAFFQALDDLSDERTLEVLCVTMQGDWRGIGASLSPVDAWSVLERATEAEERQEPKAAGLALLYFEKRFAREVANVDRIRGAVARCSLKWRLPSAREGRIAARKEIESLGGAKTAARRLAEVASWPREIACNRPVAGRMLALCGVNAFRGLGADVKRKAVQDLLWKANTTECAALVIVLLADQAEDVEVRCTAAYVLRSFVGTEEKALPALVKALKDPNEKVRADVASALRWTDGDLTVIIPALTEALSDENAAVRRNAADALKRIRAAGKEKGTPK